MMKDGADVSSIAVVWVAVVWLSLSAWVTQSSFGGMYVEGLEVVLLVTSSIFVYHERGRIRAWYEGLRSDLREEWERSREPRDPDAVIDEVVNEGDEE